MTVGEVHTPGGATLRQGAPVRDVVAGLALVLAAGAFLLSLRNARRLRRLEQRQ